MLVNATLITLPPEMVRWLAAGEVIDNLAAALRELIENALDAQATRITAEVWPEQGRVRVSDNGVGIPPQDLLAVARSGTTSKLPVTTLPPLVTTLGFRGQALHALAQAGSLSIASRIPGADHGWQTVYDHQGESQGLRPVGMDRGTVAEVAQLWRDWPQRRSQGVSRAALEQVVYGAAVTHPQVSWILQIQGRLCVHLTAGSVIERLCQRWPRVHPQDCRQGSSGSWQVVVGIPSHVHRPRPDACWVGINGRLVTIPELQTALLESFRRSLPPRRYPLCVALASLPPQQVDWNRHPAKTEVYLQDLEQHCATLRALIGELLASPTQTLPVAFLHRLREQGRSYQVSAPSPVQVLTQLDRTYIVITDGKGLALIEQHVAHERVLFERLEQQCNWIESPLLVGSLRDPEITALRELGADPEPFGSQQWRVRRIPQLLLGLPEADQIQILLILARDPDQALVTLACRTAIRNGRVLSLGEMQALVQDWQRTRQPHTCPHGRPILLRLSETDLQRFFGRRYNVCHPGLGDRLAHEIRNAVSSPQRLSTQFHPPAPPP